MKTVTITNSYSYSNKGDAAILLGTISYLKELFGENNLSINILSLTPDLDKKIYMKDKCVKTVESNILNPHPYKHTKLGKIIAIIKLFFKTIYILLFSKYLTKKEKTIQMLINSDLVIVCGGGFLGGKKLSSIIHLIQIYLNTKFSKKVITMGISIEPMKFGILKIITETILKKLDYVVAREKITYDYLKTFMDKDKIILVPDMAFMLKYEYKKCKKLDKFKSSYNTLVGLTLRDWKSNNKNLMDNYIKVVEKIIIKYSTEMNIGFVFMPQVIVSHANDLDIARKLKEQLPKKVKNSFLILDEDFSPSILKYLIGKMDCFIGTRMHSNIFALSMNIPTVAIAYEKKTNGIMKMLELDEFIVEIENINFNSLCQKFEKIQKDKEEIKNFLNFKISRIEMEIRKKLKEIILEE